MLKGTCYPYFLPTSLNVGDSNLPAVFQIAQFRYLNLFATPLLRFRS